MAAPESSWIVVPAPVAAPRLRLVCFPSAGRGPSAYRTWPKALPADIEVCVAQLPGREARVREPARAALEPLMEAILPAVAPLADRPLALFGHSFGAIVAFETARRLPATARLVHLLLAGRRGPRA